MGVLVSKPRAPVVGCSCGVRTSPSERYGSPFPPSRSPAEYRLLVRWKTQTALFSRAVFAEYEIRYAKLVGTAATAAAASAKRPAFRSARPRPIDARFRCA